MILAAYALFILMLIIPFLFSFLELWNPQDSLALEVNPDSTREPRRFSTAFKEGISSVLKRVNPHMKPGIFKLPRGDRIEVVQTKKLEAGEQVDTILYVLEELTTGKNVRLCSENYILKRAVIGERNRIKALASTGLLSLGAGTVVEDWIDAEQDLKISRGCTLGISASSVRLLEIGEDCIWRRLYGKPVRTYGYSAKEIDRFPIQVPEIYPKQPQTISDVALVSKADMTMPVESLAERRNVVVGDLKVREKSMLRGTIHSYGKVTLERYVWVSGSIFAEGSVILGENSVVLGNVFSQGNIYIKPGARIGAPGGVKSVVARGKIILGRDVVVHGFLSAEKRGLIS